MNILLIKPPWFLHGPFTKCVNVQTGPLNLGILAALSEGHHVQIVDGDIESIPYSANWDLVAITCPTVCANNVYAISEKFRSLNVKVVLGGVHPSLLPDEAQAHADSIVIGEAEGVWNQILQDNPHLKPRYQSTQNIDLNNLPFPRRDLFHPSYRTAAVQATRGCINKCKYCYLQSVPWGGYRKRLPEVVEHEVSLIKEPYLFFVDDNFFVNKEYTQEIAGRIKPFKKFWTCQAPVTIGEDEAFVKALAKAGLCGVMLGLDSIRNEALEFSGKEYVADKLARTVKCLHRYGIGVGAMLVFGFDEDDPSIFERTLTVLHKTGFDSAAFFVLTPYPGTVLFNEWEKEGRILTQDWSQYNWQNAIFKPKQMSAEFLNENIRKMYRAFVVKKYRHLYRHFPLFFRFFLRAPSLIPDFRPYFDLNPFS